MRTIELIKNRSDIGAGTRGSDMGIDALEIAAINKGSHFFPDHPHVDVKTRNASVYVQDVNPFGKHIKQIFAQCSDVAAAVQKSLTQNHFPLVISGDHSSAIGTIGGIKSAFPDKTLGIIWLDAHADIHSPFTTPSGNLHGMPLAAVLGEDNMECQINEVDSQTVDHWEKLKNLGVDGPKLHPKHLVYFGVRDTEEPEDKLIRRKGIKNYRVDEVRRKGIGACVQETIDRLEACDILYISFDVDSLDCELVSDGTGTPVPGGFLPHEITQLIQGILHTGKVIGMEVVEINPLLDSQGNHMAEIVFGILEQAFDLLKDRETA